MSDMHSEPAVPDEGTETMRRALVVYHRDGLEVVPLADRTPVVIGRTEPSDVRPKSRRLSRQHAAFELVDGTVFVEDMGSTNGTFVNGQRVTGRMVLALADEVVLGSVTVALHGLDEAWLRPLGLDGHERFVEHVEFELQRARTFDRPLAVLLIRARDPAGPRLGAWVPKLAAQLRVVDRVALHAPNCVEVLLPEMDGSRAIAFANKLVAVLQPQTEVRIGIVSHPEFLGPAAELIDAGKVALMRATDESAVEIHVDNSGKFEAVATDGPIIRDPAMAALYRTVHLVAASAISVLIVGPTGTGKELIARAIHTHSDRHDKPMRVINCGAIPESLLESTLFGHERGSFTGADQRRAGVFEEAEGGTVFLDEIGELSLAAQVALLRVLETKNIQRVGSHQEVAVNVRVVAATHRDLEAMCDDGLFRWDLLYRLNGITLQVPPLCERRSEIRPLVARFIDESNRVNGRAVRGVAPDAMVLLERYAWPGNVRELRNTTDRAVVIAATDTITVADLPERLVSRVDLSSVPTEVTRSLPPNTVTAHDLGPLDLKERVKEYEIELILAALRDTRGNQTRASKLLAMSRRTLVYKIRAYGIDEVGTDSVDESDGDPAELAQAPPASHRGDFALQIERFERQLITEALLRAQGDRQAAARLLNVQFRTLAQKLERLGL